MDLSEAAFDLRARWGTQDESPTNFGGKRSGLNMPKNSINAGQHSRLPSAHHMITSARCINYLNCEV